MPVEREKVFQAAQKLVEKKRYDKAIVEYQKLIAEDPKDVRTLLRIGDLHIKLEQYAEAITTYEQVGQFYAQQGFSGKAIAVYKQMREIINKHVPHMIDRFGHVLPTLAELYVQAGQKSEALAAYDEIATRLLKAGRDRDALKIYEKIIEVDPSNPLPQLRLAEAYLRLKDFDNAIARFGAAANTLVKSGRAGDALKVVERILQHRPDVNFARMAAEIYLERGEPNDAMTALAKLQFCFKENPKDLTVLGLLARAFDQLKQKDKALEVLKEAARVAKEAGRAHAYKAIVEELVSRAPNDAQVKQLASQQVAPHSTAEVEVSAAESEEDIDSLIADAEEAEAVEIDAEPSGPAPEASILIEPSASFETMPPESAMPIELTSHSEAATRAKQILTAAETMRLHQQYAEAIKYLRDAIDSLPEVRDLREKLYDVLFETGDGQGAIDEMMAHAHYFSDCGDTETAARILDELLLIEPGYPAATAMLAQLGYALDYDANAQPDAGGGYEEQPYDAAYGNPNGAYDTGAVALNAANPYGDPYYDPNIQNYDVSGAHPYTGDRRYGPMTSDAPLPNYPMEEESMQFIEAPPSTSARAIPLVQPAAPAYPDPQAAYPPLRSPAPANKGRRPTPIPPPPARNHSVLSQLDEDALEEIEFFAQHGMFDRAREMLDEQLSRLPNHPLVLEKKRQVEEMAGRAMSSQESGTRALPRANEVRFAPESSGGLDINAWIDQIDDKFTEMTPNQAQVVESMAQPVDVDSMMEQIKAGSNIPMQISESDAATHYDLGVAYKEMGMFTDAIAEFELASRDPGRECVCLSMIGMIYMQVGEIDAAIDAFIRGLQVRQKTREQEYALTYEVANAYAAQGLPEQALMFFQRLAHANPNYQDPRGSVVERIRGIDPTAGGAPNMHSVVQPTDNLDDAFDAMLSGTGRKH